MVTYYMARYEMTHLVAASVGVTLGNGMPVIILLLLSVAEQREWLPYEKMDVSTPLSSPINSVCYHYVTSLRRRSQRITYYGGHNIDTLI